MNQLLKLAPDLLQVRPEALLNIDRVAIERVREGAMLLAYRLAKILFLQRDAMLKRALQFGNGPQHVNLAGRAAILEPSAPFLPVLADVLQLLRFAIKRGHFLPMGTVARRDFLV